MTGHIERSRPTSSDRRSRFILVVDDNEKNLAFLSKLLLRFNYQFLSAPNGKEALEMATVIVPCLAIVSMELTDMKGFDLMKRLSGNSTTFPIPLVGLLQRDDDQHMKQQCFNNGAVGYLSRPIDAEMLYRTIQLAVEKNPRTYMRVRTVQPVRLKNSGKDGISGAHTLDLSARGMFLRTPHAVSVDATLSLQFDLGGRSISTSAQVLYNCGAGQGPYREPGIGLRFLDISSKDQEFIRQFVKDDVMRGISHDMA
jgi:CheY-like chemotaxis protein